MRSRISENGVSFFGAGGHTHNGVNSSLINTSSYSLFDFSPNYVGAQNRISRQQGNRTAMEDFIVRVVNSRVLSPAGITLEPNTLNGKTITANTITATQIAANTITATQIAANTITANNIAVGTITGVQIANGAVGNSQINNVMSVINLQSDFVTTNAVIRSTVYTAGAGGVGWSINAAGNAEFNNVTVRGTVVSGAGSVGGWTINPSSLASGSTALYSNGQATFGNTTIFSNGRITNGSLIISASGALDATGAVVRGRVEADSGVIGGWNINYSLIAGTFGATSNYIDMDPDDGFFFRKWTGGTWGSGFFTDVKINYLSSVPGIDVTGNASGSTLTTEIRSSFVKSNQVLIGPGQNDVQTLLNGKSNTGHGHAYVSISGDTMTGILSGTAISMSGNLRFGGKCYGSTTDFQNFGSTGGSPSGDVIFRVNSGFTLYNRSLTPGGSNRAVYINSDNTLFCGANVSSLRYKNNITNAEIDTENFLKTRVVNFYYNDELCDLENQPVKERYVGLIAEELDELGLSDLLEYDDQGRPDILKKDSIPFYLLKVCQDQEAKIKALEDRIQTLEGV